ncbi:uncharacterized protein [Miscanthus floridulus]|uniref:uncharacterized protein n=1 Tax=Miscanthus floridulus TaxID=154761 RepID=UPI003458B99F
MTDHFSFDFTSTVLLGSTTSDLRFAVTNVYGPSDHSFTDLFLVELVTVAGSISDLWILIGDFKLTRARSDKNTLTFNSNLATRFNHTIDALQVIELPLLYWLFTWTNKRATPTLARLDRAFINIAFSDAFPGTTLTSGNRPTSDHTTLLASIQTNIPKPKSFRLERSWLLDPSYLPSVTPAWQSIPRLGDKAQVLVAQVKVKAGLFLQVNVACGINVHNACTCFSANEQPTGSSGALLQKAKHCRLRNPHYRWF